MAESVDFGILLGLSYARFVEELRTVLFTAGFDDLGTNDGYVVRILADSPISTSDLAREMAITKQGAAQVVADLEARGYVTRRPHPVDRRTQLVALSTRGEALLAAARRFHRQYERTLARRVGADAVADTRRVLTAVVDGDDERPITSRRLRPF
jgi:DNA-binding MarR family transcriptional regulator